MCLPYNLALVQSCYSYLFNSFIFKAHLHNDGIKAFLNDFIQKQIFVQEFLSLVYELFL